MPDFSATASESIGTNSFGTDLTEPSHARNLIEKSKNWWVFFLSLLFD